jgi:hypothetical protein
MNDKNASVKQKNESKSYWFVRLPSGERVLCFSARRHGKTERVKVTLEHIGKEFRDALFNRPQQLNSVSKNLLICGKNSIRITSLNHKQIYPSRGVLRSADARAIF